MMECLESKLDKLGQTKAANEVFQKMIDTGALEEISATELGMRTGLIHYLPIQGVFKPTSLSACPPCDQFIFGGSRDWPLPEFHLDQGPHVFE